METSDDPITIAVVGTMVAGAGISAYGQYQQGKAAEAQAESEQELLNYNAAIKAREAEANDRRTMEQARRFEEEGAEFLGKQKVTIAKGGILSKTGSADELVKESIAGLEYDKRALIGNGFLESSFLLSEAEGLKYQGRSAIARGANIRTGANLAAVGSLLTGTGSAAMAGYTVGGRS